MEGVDPTGVAFGALGFLMLHQGLENLALSNFEDAYEHNPDLVGLGRNIADTHRQLAQELIANDVDAACRILAGSARSMGIEVVGS